MWWPPAHERDHRLIAAVGGRVHNLGMEKPTIVSAEEWQQARDDLLKAEKELTRAQDALAARRRRLPMVKV